MRNEKTQEFNATSTMKKRRNQLFGRRGLFIAAFAISLVITAAILSAMIIDYRGRAIAQGDAGSIFDITLTERTAAVTVFGYDLLIDRSIVDNIGNGLMKIWEYVYNSVPLNIRLSLKKIPYYFNAVCYVFYKIFSLIFA